MSEMKELKKLSKNLFISLKKLNRFMIYQCFCIFMILLSQQNLSQSMTSHDFLFHTCHHQIIFAKIDLDIHLPPPYKREVWSYNRGKVELINQAISLFDWDSVLAPLDVNNQVTLSNETLLNIFRNFIPRKLLECNGRDAPWITREIKTSLRGKNRL